MVISIIYLAAAVLGVSIARSPMKRRSYWARWGVLLAVIVGLLLLPPALESIATPGSGEIGPGILLMLFTGLLAIPAAIFLAFLWQGRRMIDASGSKWWAMLGVVPFAFIVFGVLPSRPPHGLDQKKAVEVFR